MANRIILPHSNYRQLKSFQTTTIIYDFTMAFCNQYRSLLTYKNYEQMIGAARSGKQNIAEGSQVSGTSKKTEIKLTSVARGSLEELLQDCLDFLRLFPDMGRPDVPQHQFDRMPRQWFLAQVMMLEERGQATHHRSILCLHERRQIAVL